MRNTHNTTVRWRLGQLLLFRMVGVYFILYSLPFLFYFYRSFYKIYEGYYKAWLPGVQWVGKHILGIPYKITILPNGSSDTTYNYVHIFLLFLLTLIITGIWTVFDRKRRHYNTLYYWLRVLMRYYLFCVMFSYGFAKIFKTQFPFPDLSDLSEPFGNASPMGVVWRFMGYSYAYNIFTGGVEILGGLLLLSQRTATLGALVLTGVMINIVMLNFCFDIPVKLYAIHLLAQVIFLTIPDWKRSIRVFILNKPTVPTALTSPFENKNYFNTRIITKLFLVVFVIYTNIINQLEAEHWGDRRAKPPLYGIYEVEYHVQNGDTLAPTLDNRFRWKRLLMDYPGRATVKTMTDATYHYFLQADTLQNIIKLNLSSDTLHQMQLTYIQEDSTLYLQGKLQNDQIFLQLRRRDPNHYFLMKRGFNWINEYPLNQ